MKRLLLISAFSAVAACQGLSALSADLPPSPLDAVKGTVVPILRSPKDPPPPVAMARQAPTSLVLHPLDTTNAPPIAVISIDVRPGQMPYGFDPGLTTPVPRKFRFDGGDCVFIEYPVKAGKTYQTQVKLGLDDPDWHAWFHFVAGRDDLQVTRYPLIVGDGARFFRVMSNE
jgi:hypothetical protein